MRPHLKNKVLKASELKIGDIVRFRNTELGPYNAMTVTKCGKETLATTGEVDHFTLCRPYGRIADYGTTSPNLCVRFETVSIFGCDSTEFVLLDRDTFDIFDHFVAWEVGVCDKMRLAKYFVTLATLVENGEFCKKDHRVKMALEAYRKDGIAALLSMDSLQLKNLTVTAGYELIECRMDVPNCPERYDGEIHEYAKELEQNCSLNGELSKAEENFLVQYKSTSRV